MELVKFDQARKALAEASSIDEILDIKDKMEALKLYLRQHGESREMQNHCALISIRAQQKAADIVDKMQENGELASNGRPKKRLHDVTFLSDLDIDKVSLHRWRKIQAIPDDKINEYAEKAIANNDELTTAGLLRFIKNLNVHFTSNSPEWYTPPHIIQSVVDVLGKIDIDPCSNGKDSIPANKLVTLNDNGLSIPWKGKAYMNPPYGREISMWIDKLVNEYENGNILEAISLTPSRTDTKWFRRLRPFPKCFIWGRLNFSEYDNSAPFPSMVTYIGSNVEKFSEVFSNIGDIYLWYTDLNKA